MKFGNCLCAVLASHVLVLLSINAQPLARELNAPSFEVVSVKPNGTNQIMSGVPLEQGCRPLAHGVSCNLTMSGMLQKAFSVSEWQISEPAWAKSDLYKVLASMPAEQDGKLIGPMIRTMLFERFGLIAHLEQKETSVYALVVGKRGAKLQEVTNPGVSNSRGGKGEFSSTAMHMNAFAGNLSNAAGRPVIDMTGLKGAYKIDLHWTPEYEEFPGRGRKDVGILNLLDELGLKLEARKMPFDRIVVDHAERIPTAN